MSEKILSLELGDLEKQKRISIITDQRLVMGVFGNSYAKAIVNNIQGGMTIEEATETAKAGMTRWTSIPCNKVLKVKHVDHGGAFNISYLNDKEKTASLDMSAQEKPNRTIMLENLKQVLPHLTYQTSKASFWESIIGHLFALVFALVVGVILIGTSFMDPSEINQQDSGSGRRKGRALYAVITYVAGLLGPIGCISCTVVAVGIISYLISNAIKNPPTKHELLPDNQQS